MTSSARFRLVKRAGRPLQSRVFSTRNMRSRCLTPHAFLADRFHPALFKGGRMLAQNFLDTPKRIPKPRDFGLTALIDNGVPTRYFTDVVESDADLIDVVKFGW